MSLLAIDIGSSGCKAIAFSTNGDILGHHTSLYSPKFPRPSFAEIDPEKFWDALCSSCRSATGNLTDPVRAFCLSSHGETFVPVDSRGQPVSNAILNQDNRAVCESSWLEETIGRQRLFQITGHFAHPMYPLAKILWLRENEPGIFGAAKCFITLIGYLLQRMGLPPYTDYSLASRYLAFDIHKLCWSEEILNAAKLHKMILPVPVPAGTITGHLNSEAASQLGIPAGTPIVLGGHDQPCGALGAGVIGEGLVSDSIGTYECLVAAANAPSLSEKALAASLNSYCHVVPEKFVTLAYFPSGIMIKWLHDLLYAGGTGEVDEDLSGRNLEASHYAFLESLAPEGPTGLCITPHLIGTCNPEFNPRVRGLIAGLEPRTTRGHLYKGILEGLACELSVVTQALAQAVGNFADLYVCGGGTRSALGVQLRAALTGRRLHVMSRHEAVCLGTAILAGVAIGEFESIGQAAANLVRESAVIAPDKTMAESYREQVKQYRRLRAFAVQQA